DRGRAHSRRGAQLRRRVPELEPGADLRAHRAGGGPDDPPVRAVLRESRPAGVAMTLLRHLVAALIVGAGILALSVQLSAFRDFQMAEIAVYVVAIAGLSFLIGLSGQISLGHGAFMAIGAYTAALLMLHLNWPLWAVFPAGAAVTGLAGAVVGLAAARLHD